MELTNNPEVLKNIIRQLERKLGILDMVESSCCGVTFAQCHAIVEIGRVGTISLNDLADLLGLDKSTMSRTINILVNNEMVDRETDQDDRRYIKIKLTEKGLTSYREIESGMMEYFTQIFRAIPEAKRDQVFESLQILFKALDDVGCPNCCKKD